jgi:hypothetical protein
VEQNQNVIEGVRIIHKYDPNATMELKHNNAILVLADTLSYISDEDTDKLYSLGWYQECREVWIYDPDAFCEEF